MTTTNIADVQDQIQTFWSPIYEDLLKEQTVLPALVSKEYEGAISAQGDTVKVSAIDDIQGAIKTIGDADYDSYSAEKISQTQVSVTADTIIEAGVKIESIAALQSQLGAQDSKIRMKLFQSLEENLNSFLYGKVAPSASAPDHITDSVADFNASVLGDQRVLASQAKWSKGERWILLDPQYYQDMLNAVTMTSGDYGAADAPSIGGQFVLNRFGWNIVEDDSAAMNKVSPTNATSDLALGFVPDWVYFVRQMGVTFKLSDLHAQQKRGYLLTAELICGAALGIEGAKKHLTVYNA